MRENLLQSVLPLARFALQLALLATIIREFSLESAAFFRLTLLAFSGFVIHELLPLRYRMTFFALLSLAGVWLVFGFASGLTLAGFGLVLIGICHLPARVGIRVALLLAAGVLLALLRSNVISSAVPMAVWPILGSMFMFRLCVYFYDLQTEKAPLSLSRTLSYFFLLPNVVFPLFPVVDYKTFRRTYYDEESARIYRKGIRWILRGVIQLLIYRLVYYRLAIAPSQVSDVFDLARFLVANFMLYLRVSGQFHIAIGMLHLFGFNLPETHHLYYLASGFNDFWRRINIYWKDFMVKLVYYPAFFRLRKLGPTPALVLSTTLVFASTWLLHSYQWFWLLGSFPLTWQDALFWGVLAILVIMTSLNEMRPRAMRQRAPDAAGRGDAVWTAVRTAGTFAVICVLWSVWTSESLAEWWAMWQVVPSTVALDFRWTPILIVGVVAAGVAAKTRGGSQLASRLKRLRTWWESESATVTILVILAALGQPFVQSRLVWPANAVLATMGQGRLNVNDARLLERGYYENLLSVDRFNSQLWELYTRRPAAAAVTLADTPLVRQTGDFLRTELVPSKEMIFNGAKFSTNRWGLRDRDYELERPPDTYRIALLGSSHALGWGVADDETFENILESRLNQFSERRPYSRYELLNFAVGAYAPLQQLVSLERKALSFDPNAILYVAHLNDLRRAVGHVVARYKERIAVPFEGLQRLVRSKGVDEHTSTLLVGRRLEPYSKEILQWTYHEIVRLSRARGILPLWAFMPTLEDNGDDVTPEDLENLAKEAGFLTVSLADVYSNRSRESLWVAQWDRHPNAEGHVLVADKLLERLQEIDRTHALGVFLEETSPANDMSRRRRERNEKR